MTFFPVVFKSRHQICGEPSTTLLMRFLLLLAFGDLLAAAAPTHAPPSQAAAASNDAVDVAMASQVLFNQMLTDNNAYYNELEKYQQRQQQLPHHYLSKWPGLRDLLLTAADYEDNNNAVESNEVTNTRFYERLRQMADNSVGELIEDARDENGYNNSNNNSNHLSAAAAIAGKTFKEHGTKKNAQLRKQYMSPCHFKICNMGRKRNVLFLSDYLN